MAVIVVNDVSDIQDVVELINYLAGALATGDTEALLADGTFTLTRSTTPTDAELHELVRLDEDEVCLDPVHRTGCSCVEDAADTDPRQLALLESAHHFGPVPYLPCPRQGTHRTLTECWMCWSDVHRGAITAEQALA